jgi:predicted dithiol-disulfide oxidoreductase (DUF899 family)
VERNTYRTEVARLRALNAELVEALGEARQLLMHGHAFSKSESVGECPGCTAEVKINAALAHAKEVGDG